MKITTKSVVTHRGTITSEEKKSDGGRSLILEAVDFIHSERQTGTLVAQFGVGGSLSSLQFVETHSIPQKDIQVLE